MSARALLNRPPSPSPNSHLERRASTRQQCLREVTCQAVMTLPDEIAPALVEELSTTGMRLVLRRCYEPGRVLVVTWRHPHGYTQHTLLVHVIHARDHGGGNWSMGCTLVGSLSPEEMADLL